MSVDKRVTVRFGGSVRIERSARDVFAVLADVQDWATGPGSPVVVMEKTPQGPTAVGTQWREVVRLGLGRTLTIWSEVTAIEPGRLLAMQFRGGHMGGDLVYTLTSCDGYTALRQQETLSTSGPLRPFGWLVGLILKPRLWRRLIDVRDLLERAGEANPIPSDTTI